RPPARWLVHAFPTRRSSDLLLVREGEVEDRQVLALALRSRRLRDRDCPQLVMPAQEHLRRGATVRPCDVLDHRLTQQCVGSAQRDRKSTRLNSSHVSISYAV